MSSTAIALTPTVTLNGQPLTTAFYQGLVEIRIEREFQLPGRCTLRFIDPEYDLAGTSTVAMGTTVEVADPSDASLKLISAEITSISIEQSNAGQPELVLVAMDKSHRMARTPRAQAYNAMAYSDIVNQLVATYGLSADVSATTPVFDYVMQADSDLGFITELAQRVGYDWWVDGTTFYFQPPQSQQTVSLTIGVDLHSFSVRASGLYPNEVTIDGWDRDQQQLVTATASTPTPAVLPDSDLVSKRTGASGSFGTSTVTTSSLNAQTQAESQSLSQSFLDRAAADSVTASGTTVGNGNIALGASVSVAGAGPANGTYPVTKVEHLFRPQRGFVTRFSAGSRRPQSLVDTLAGGRATAASIHTSGVTVGQVTNINDPESRGRVKVQYPGASSTNQTGWARIVGLGGGASRGHVFIPETSDEVLVAFEGGDTRQPVVIGGLYGAKSTIPTPQLQDGQVAARTMTSRLGHTMSMLDGTAPAQQALVFQLAGQQHTLHLGKDAAQLTVPSGTPLKISAGNTSITFGQDGSISVAGPSITIQADQQLKLSAPNITIAADASLSLEGQAQAALKGAQVQVEGEAMTTIKGAMVMIN